MTDRWRKVVVTAGALTAALIVYISFQGLEAQYRWRAQTVPMVVASAPLQAGTLLEPSHLRIREVPREFRPESALTDVGQVVGKVLVSDLDVGQELTRVNLADPDQVKDLGRKIPVGHRAVFLPVTPESGIGQHLRPGARVDLIAVSGESGWSREEASTIAQDVAVLDVVFTAEPGKSLLGDGDGKPTPSAVALAVNPLQAQVVSLAQQTGKVEIVLRPDNDRALHTTLPSGPGLNAPVGRGTPAPAARVVAPPVGSSREGWDDAFLQSLTGMPVRSSGGGSVPKGSDLAGAGPIRPNGSSSGPPGASDRVVEVIHGTESVRQSVAADAGETKGD